MIQTSEERLAVTETKITTLQDDIKDIKTEVHEIDNYLRTELISRINEEHEKERDYKKEHRAKIQIWGAISVAIASLAITLIHVFL